MPANNFGVRWSTTRDFGSGGPFTFTASSRDGIRVYLDGVRKVDLWKNVATTVSKTVNVTIPSGKHSLRVDFVNWTGAANVKFAYVPRTSATVDKVRPLVPTGPPSPTARRPRPRRSAGPRTRRWTSPGTACTGG
ncbi:PA14 domain-containing protein [Streptomyces sp. NBC_01527]|uniref:PA14 domain-containing protein n=1 Tax=Streptomyces sp. NBC_01527 TaxID=2903894 RepID=UPI003870D102